MPSQHLQPVEAGARLRRQPDRPHRDARQPHLRLLGKNVVSDYSHEKPSPTASTSAKISNPIDTHITQKGGRHRREQQVEKRERLTRKKRWEQQDEDAAYSATPARPRHRQPDQIRTVIRAFRDNLPAIFPGREKSPRPSFSPRPTATPTTSSTPCARNSAKGNAFCKKSPTAPRRTKAGRQR